MMSAACAAALAGIYATAEAQGVLVPVEIEGPVQSFAVTPGTFGMAGEMTVMGQKIKVNETTALVTPTTTTNPFASTRTWMQGGTMNGRQLGGILGGTVIITAEYNSATGELVASEVFTDVAENVVLGVVTASSCSNVRCNGAEDYIKGNGNLLGEGGVAFIPNKDARLRALPPTDAGLFELNMNLAANNGLVGTPDAPTTFGVEGYYSDNKVAVWEDLTPDDEFTTKSPTENAIVFWSFELGENRPDLVRTPAVSELSVLRVRCTEGGTLEARGFVHAPMRRNGSALGGAGNPLTGGDGVIRVTMDLNNDSLIDPATEIFTDTPTADLPATYGVYRVRADVETCGTVATVEWAPDATAAAWDTAADVPVDRLRLQ